MERTLIIIKPDGIQRKLIGNTITRFENKGLQMVAAKFIKISKQLAAKHYEVHKTKPFFEPIVKFLSSDPVLIMVLQGKNAITNSRTIIGATTYKTAVPGSIRGDYACTDRYNIIHGSDSIQSAEYEISLYFKPEEIIDYDMKPNIWLDSGID